MECTDGEAAILRLMMHPRGNRQRMEAFLRRLHSKCRPALLDCSPDNSDALTSHGLLQGTDLRSVDCKHWTPGKFTRLDFTL